MKKNWKTKKSDYLCSGDVIFFHVICDFWLVSFPLRREMRGFLLE